MRRIAASLVIGVGLLTLLGGWALVAHAGAPEAGSWAGACGVVAGGLVAGALLGRADPAFPGLLVLAIVVAAVVLTAPASLSGDPAAPPLGYLNANGALLVAGAAGAVLAAAPHPVRWRRAAAALAVGLAVGCLALQALTATVACLLVAAWGLWRGRGPAWTWVVTGVALVVVPPLLTVGWASGAVPRPGPVVIAFSLQRISLWTEAWDLLVLHPVAGVGPGRFSERSPTAADPDLAWAHSALLQTGAELGWVGVGLLLLVVAWAVVVLGRDGVLLGALLLPAAVDYVLHFGGVLLVSSLVVGGAAFSAGSGKPWLTPPSP